MHNHSHTWALVKTDAPWKHQEIIESTQLKRQGDVKDIANTCSFLINKADYITGQIIDVDGGRNLSR